LQDWESIKGHYDLGEEDGRLKGRFNFERLRTLDIFSRLLPKPPALIYDIGGATGVYAFPLAELGYQVHLIEPVESQLSFAKLQNQTAEFPITSLEVGNALKLEKKDASADAVLLMGPLYHLVSSEDRIQALQEAYRVLKTGGVLFSAAISRYASLMDLFDDAEYHEDAVKKMVFQDLQNGQHRCPPGKDLFTTAFFHLPDELKAEHESVGFKNVKILGVEGPVWQVSEKVMEQPGALEARMETLRMIEEDPNILCSSPHFLAVARKV
jgi:ubiquinone/menaquinone biosynthesis C-methylase UbiE